MAAPTPQGCSPERPRATETELALGAVPECTEPGHLLQGRGLLGRVGPGQRGGQGSLPPCQAARGRGQEYCQKPGVCLPSPDLYSAHGPSPKCPCTARPTLGMGHACPSPQVPEPLPLTRRLSTEANASHTAGDFHLTAPRAFQKSKVLKNVLPATRHPVPASQPVPAPSWLVRPMAGGVPWAATGLRRAHKGWAEHKPQVDTQQGSHRRNSESPAVQRGWEGACPSSSTSFSYGFGVKSFRPPESGLRGRRRASAQAGTEGQQLCLVVAGTVCVRTSSFPMTSEDPLSEPHLTAGGLAPPVTPPCEGSVNAGHTMETTGRGDYCKRPRGHPTSSRYPTVKVTSGRVLGGATSAVAAGRRRRRRDFHVLAEDGLEGLVSVHHGAEHQRLAGERCASARDRLTQDKATHPRLGWPWARSAWNHVGSGRSRAAASHPEAKLQINPGKRQGLAPSGPFPSPSNCAGPSRGPQPPGPKLHAVGGPCGHGRRTGGGRERGREGASRPLCPAGTRAGQWL